MILTIIQARMASSRLPGKVLLDIAGKPMLQWVVERAGMAETVDRVVVATTTDPSDDPVAAFCKDRDITFTRGHPHDVLDRYVRAARQCEAGIVVRITADCPLIDPGLVDRTVRRMVGARGRVSDAGRESSSRKEQDLFDPPDTRNPAAGTAALDFTANRLPPPWGRTYPIGLDVEVVRMDALERAWEEAQDRHHREHVMPYFYDDLPSERLEDGEVYETARGFRVAQLHHTTDHGRVRWTVDTPEDLAAVRALAAHLAEDFTWPDALAVWHAHPEIAAINADVQHKTAKDIDDRS